MHNHTIDFKPGHTYKPNPLSIEFRQLQPAPSAYHRFHCCIRNVRFRKRVKLQIEAIYSFFEIPLFFSNLKPTMRLID